MTFTEIILVGHLGNDPELKFLPSGTATCEFSLATNRKWTDKASGEKHEETTWFRIHVYGQQAETVNQYVQKGKQVLVVGDRIEASPYLSKDSGEPRASLEVTARTVKFLGSKSSDGQSDAPPQDTDDIPF